MSKTNTTDGRKFTSFSLDLTADVKKQMLNWGNQFNICCFMDNNGYTASHHSYECILAVGDWKCISVSAGHTFDLLNAFYAQQNDWLFGHFGFGLKAETENVSSALTDPHGFPDSYFFVPEHLLLIGKASISISSYSMEPAVLMQAILNIKINAAAASEKIDLIPSLTRDQYLAKINALKAHIHRGDCYEINFCQEFYHHGAEINPVAVFHALDAASPNPFSVYYKLNERYLLCASPERYLRIEGNQVWSQPIKGTAPRNLSNEQADTALANNMAHSAKERAENVMVVDLVRNDLSKICNPGSVQVEELFGIYSFPQVHQLISTIRGDLKPGINWIDAVRGSFPMGSMTGAPKKKVLELIDKYETVARGIFSGAVGYCKPDGDIDFNVVIRSIMYSSDKKYLSCLVGSGITWYADPVNEYEECLLKIDAITKVLQKTGATN